MTDDVGGADNVVHLGTSDLAAIGKVLREMYAFYVQSKPPERLERLLAMIGENGKEPRAGSPESAAEQSDAAPT